MIPLNKAHDKEEVGNKAYSLYELAKIGMPVPDGFVIPHNAQKKDIVEYLRKHAKNTLYAVRSSSNLEDASNHSFAGLFKTELCVSKKDLLKAILDVRNVNDLTRLHEFCNEAGIKTAPKVSVLVQEMVPSETSGICFTRNPVSKNKQEIVIEAAKGLGEFVVGSEVTPDMYRVGKNGKIREKKIATQHKQLTLGKPMITERILNYSQKLSDELIHELAELALKIENHMGYFADIEWAVSKNKLYILQSRPITT